MKNIFFSVLSLFLTVGVFAQGSTNPEIRKATDEMIKVYDLNADQAATALEIQERRFRNLGEIASLEKTDKGLYKHKYKAIQQSTDASLRRMLNESQMEIYNARKMDLRIKRAKKTAELKGQGLSIEEIEDALFELEKN